MNEGIITSRYAKALYQAGDEIGKTDAIKEDIDGLYQTINESEEFVDILESPIVKTSDKERILKEVFAGKIQDMTLNFLLLLVQNKREQFLPSICLQYLQQYKEKNNIKEAVIITAKPLDKSHKDEIHKYINKKFKIDVDLDDEVDESLIGGFKLRIEDKQIDTSISSKLRKIKTELINS